MFQRLRGVRREQRRPGSVRPDFAFWLFSGDDFDAPIGLAISVIGGLIVGWALGKCAETAFAVVDWYDD